MPERQLLNVANTAKPLRPSQPARSDHVIHEEPTAHRGGASAASKRRFLIRMVTVLIGGMVLDGYVLGIIGPVSGRMAEDLQLTAFWQGLIAAAALVGILIGSPIGGWASDKWGRKPIFMFDIGLFAIASGMQFFVDSPILLIVVRLLMGIAIGTEYAVGWPLMAEFSPTHLRGRLMAAMGIAWYGGFMLAFLIGHLLNEYTDLSWHFILGTSTFIAVALFLARLGMPESPRWLWSVGRKDEARALAAKYMPDDALDDVQHEDVRKGSFGMLFSKEYWRSTLFISGFWFCAVTPYFAIATFADSVLDQYGLAGGLAGGVGLSAVALAGVVVTFLLIEKAGRRGADRSAAVAVRRCPRDHRTVGRRAGPIVLDPVPGLLVLQRGIQHVDERLPG